MERDKNSEWKPLPLCLPIHSLFFLSLPYSLLSGFLIYFISLLYPRTHTYPKCHMYENHASIRQQICHDFCMAAIYIGWINLITGAKGNIFLVSPTCHYHWRRSAQCEVFIIRCVFIKEIYNDYMAYCTKTADMSYGFVLLMAFCSGKAHKRVRKQRKQKRPKLRSIKETKPCLFKFRKFGNFL